MKKLLLPCLLALVLTGCMPRLGAPVRIVESRSVTTFDFAPFLEQGFLFLPGSYGDMHESLGFIEVRFSPKTSDALKRPARDLVSGWAQDDGRAQVLLQQMSDAATALGADAVSHFRVDIERDDVGSPVYHLSGFAIRRL